MPWRLIIFLVTLTLFIIFSGLNTQSVEIHFGFYTIEKIPLFVTVFIAFVSGAALALPITLISSIKRKKVIAENKVKKQTKKGRNKVEQLEQNTDVPSTATSLSSEEPEDKSSE